MELELKECNLKDFEDMFSIKKFPKLAELDLTGNHFSSVKMLGNLPTLKILILQANKIETLYHNNDIAILKGLNGCQVPLFIFLEPINSGPQQQSAQRFLRAQLLPYVLAKDPESFKK